ncbi:hypothetical protein GGS26DRAFT_525724 [Hypomontagnella submonticulosa]|nr:hypothetical protein GGS26DRAFT_525724 [Hypomontagnella submonticulosa]
MLAKFLVSRLSKEVEAESTQFCYFLFRDDNNKQKTAVSALCALLHRIFKYNQCLISHAIRVWQLEGQKALEDFWSLWGILTAVAEDARCPQLTCVIDGLDECEEQSRQDFIRALLQGPSVLRLRAEELGREVRHDIELVVGAKLNKLVKNGRLNSDQQDRVRKALLGNAGQTFLWISLFLAEFETSKVFHGKDREYLELLNNPPPNLDSVYERILKRRTDPKLAQKILHAVVAAARPLTPAEMNIALSIEPRHKRSGELKPDLFPEQGLEKLIGDSCGHIVGFEGRGRRRRINLVHQTAKEFLVKKPYQSMPKSDIRGPLNWLIYALWYVRTRFLMGFLGLWKGSLDPVESNRVVARVCMEYLLLESFDNCPTFRHSNRGMMARYTKEHAFLDYSAKHWASHFRQGQFQQGSPAFDSALRLCNTESRRFWLWFGMYWRASDTPWHAPSQITDLMVASYFGFEGIVRSLHGGCEWPSKHRTASTTPWE